MKLLLLFITIAGIYRYMPSLVGCSHFSFFASCKRSEYLPIRKYSTSLLQTKAMKVTSFSVILLSIVSCTAAESGRVLCSQLQGRHEELPCEDDVESPPESKFHIDSLRTSLCFRKELCLTIPLRTIINDPSKYDVTFTTFSF